MEEEPTIFNAENSSESTEEQCFELTEEQGIFGAKSHSEPESKC